MHFFALFFYLKPSLFFERFSVHFLCLLLFSPKFLDETGYLLENEKKFSKASTQDDSFSSISIVVI